MRTAMTFLVLLAALGLAGARAPAAGKLTEEGARVLVTLPRDFTSKYVAVSPDGTEIAVYARKKDDPGPGWIFTERGAQRAVGVVHARTLSFTPDGKHLVYHAPYVVLDGKTLNDCWELAFSRDGSKRLFMMRTASGERTLYYNGKVVDKGPYIYRSLTFAPGDRHIACIRRHVWSQPPPEPEVILLDGAPGPAYPGITLLRFSPDGNRLAYVAWGKQVGSRHETYLVVDGKPLNPDTPYQEIYDVMFSPDSKRIACVARRDRGKYVFAWDEKTVEFTTLIYEGAAFTPDGKHFVYSMVNPGHLERDHYWAFYVDGERQPGLTFGALEERMYGGFRFSSDGEHLLFTTEAQPDYKAVALFVDGLQGPPHDSIYLPDDCTATPGKVRCIVRDDNTFSRVDVVLPPGRTWTDACKTKPD